MGSGKFRCGRPLSITILSLFLWNLSNKPSAAQMDIRPDSTLGTENSIPVVQGNNTYIEGGASRGINLFHSFEEFNIGEGEAAYFSISDTAIENILTRITGNDPSDILGTLGTCISGDCPNAKPSATLYFLNPHGILFGPQASLDVGGSFVATTASGIQFGTQGSFNSNLSEDSSLLAINPSAFLFSQIGAGSITNSSRGDAGITPSGRSGIFGLRVPDNETFLLLGGDVKIDNGGLVVFDGQLEIGSVAGAGVVDLEIEENSLSLNFPEDLERGDVTLDNQAGLLAVTATTSRDARLQAQDISILNGSGIYTGIAAGIQNTDAQFGTLTLNATGNVVISGNRSLIQNSIPEGASGNSGDIDINANSVLMSNGGTIDASVRGRGSAGRINIFADDSITVNGEQSDSFIFNQIYDSGNGTTGGILLDTSSVTINSASLVLARVLGEGNTGAIRIVASDKVTIEGSNLDDNGIPTDDRTVISTSVQGRGGDSEGISIVTNNLQVTDLAQLVSFVGGNGNSGDITINATGEVLLHNGDIITEVTEGRGRGDAGNIEIDAASLTMRNAASILSDTEYFGNAGNITISTDGAITLEGLGRSALDPTETDFPSQISSTVEILGVGRGGDITINGGSLQMTDNAFINAFTSGRGDAGAIEIDVNSLTMAESADITTSSFSGGQAGDIDVLVRDRLSIDGNDSGLFSNTEDPLLEFESSDDAGSLLETAQEIDSTGDNESSYQIAGNLSDENDVDVYRVFLEENSLFSATTINDITSRLETDTRLFLFNADGKGLYFNDDLNSEEYQSIIENVELAAGEYYLAITNFANEPVSELGEIFDDRSSYIELLGPNDIGGAAPLQGWTEGQGSGPYVIDVDGINGPVILGSNGGTITISAGELSLTNGAEISTASSSSIGTAGEITFNIAETLYLSDGNITTEAPNSSGGDITINDGESISGVVILEGDSDITTESAGNGGNITIRMPVVAFDDSDIVARSQNANGGNITLGSLFSDIIPFDETAPFDGDGRVDVNAAGEVSEGDIDITDTSFLQNELAELASSLENIDTLVLNSCVVRGQENDGSVSVSGGGNLQTRPDSNATAYSTGTVRSVNGNLLVGETLSESHSWQTDRAITEPEAIYQLADGRLVMNRDCQS